MQVAIIANFPLHVIAPSQPEFRPTAHYATWLPPLMEAWSQDDGIRKTWITLHENVTERRDFTFQNQIFVVLPCQKKGRASSFFKADRAAIAEVLREIKPDLVHGWGTEDVHALAAATSGYPWLISMQGILSHYVLHAKMEKRVWWQALCELYLLHQRGHFSCETRWGAAVLHRRAPRARISIVEYAAHPDFFRSEWKPDPQRPAVLFAGTLDLRKGFQDLLAAFASPRLRDFELWVAGSGPLDTPEARALPNVKWLGRLDRPQLIEAMSQAWCLALPTRGDTSPNVVKEARVVGLPVVTTSRGGQSDYIVDGRNGFIVEPGNITQLVARLAALLSNHAECLTRGRDRWEKDRDSFRVEIMAEKFRSLYRQLQIRSSV